MWTVPRVLIPLAVAAVLLAAAPAAGAAKRRVPHGFYGVMVDRGVRAAPADEQERQWALMARSGVEAVRTVFSWAEAQPLAGMQPSFATTDALAALAARHGIRLLPIVMGTPSWAAAYPGQYASPPARPADYAAYLRALIGRYGPAGTFWDEHPDLPRRPLREWQIWNEPHLPAYWHVEGGSTTAWARGYARLLRAAHAAVKRADRRATVVLAGVADYAWKHLARLYRAGVRGRFDVASVNFFTSRPELVIRGLRYVRRALRRGGEPRKPMWLTETTWPASRGRARSEQRAAWQLTWETSDRGMGKRLRRFYSLAADRRRRLRLARVYWYTWSSAYAEGDLFDYSGLVRYDGTAFDPRPALRSYAAIARRHQGCRKTGAGRCR